MTNHPPLGLVDVFAATIPTLTFTPGVHVNYAETVLPMRDGLPKLKDFPKEIGGSGERSRNSDRLLRKSAKPPVSDRRVKGMRGLDPLSLTLPHQAATRVSAW